MTERLIVAFAIIVGITLIGLIARRVSARRDARLMDDQVIDTVASLRPRLLTFSGTWCADCRSQQRIIERVIGDWKREVEVAYVDVIAESELARRFAVMTIPTTVVTAADGRIVEINRGLVDDDRLRAQLALIP